MFKGLRDVWTSIVGVREEYSTNCAPDQSLKDLETPADLMRPGGAPEGPVRVVCAFCGKLRSAKGRWVTADPSELAGQPHELSHGMCPSCFRSRFPEDFAVLNSAEGFAEGLPLLR